MTNCKLHVNQHGGAGWRPDMIFVLLQLHNKLLASLLSLEVCQLEIQWNESFITVLERLALWKLTNVISYIFCYCCRWRSTCWNPDILNILNGRLFRHGNLKPNAPELATRGDCSSGPWRWSWAGRWTATNPAQRAIPWREQWKIYWMLVKHSQNRARYEVPLKNFINTPRSIVDCYALIKLHVWQSERDLVKEKGRGELRKRWVLENHPHTCYSGLKLPGSGATVHEHVLKNKKVLRQTEPRFNLL